MSGKQIFRHQASRVMVEINCWVFQTYLDLWCYWRPSTSHNTTCSTPRSLCLDGQAALKPFNDKKRRLKEVKAITLTYGLLWKSYEIHLVSLTLKSSQEFGSPGPSTLPSDSREEGGLKEKATTVPIFNTKPRKSRRESSSLRIFLIVRSEKIERISSNIP